MSIDWDFIWNVLNKVAIIGTIIGIPATIVGICRLFYGGIIVYDCYKEPNSAKGDTVVIGNFSKRDRKKAKKKTPKGSITKKDSVFIMKRIGYKCYM